MDTAQSLPPPNYPAAERLYPRSNLWSLDASSFVVLAAGCGRRAGSYDVGTYGLANLATRPI